MTMCVVAKKKGIVVPAADALLYACSGVLRCEERRSGGRAPLSISPARLV